MEQLHLDDSPDKEEKEDRTAPQSGAVPEAATETAQEVRTVVGCEPTADAESHRAAGPSETTDRATCYDQLMERVCTALHGLGHEIGGVELHDLFQDPLTEVDPGTPLDELGHLMDSVLARPERLSWALEEVLEGKSLVLRPYRPLSDLIDERDLKEQGTALRRHLREDAAFRRRIEHARQDAHRRRCRAAIVEGLVGGETRNTSRHRALADSLEEAVRGMEQTLHREIGAVEDRLRHLPTERARALRPVSQLRLKRSSFGPNIADRDCRYLRDRYLIVNKAAINRKDRAAKLADRGFDPTTTTPRFPEILCARIFRAAVSCADQEATLLGYFRYRRRDPWKPARVIAKRVAVAVTERDEAVFLDADRVRFVDSAVSGFTRLMVHIRAAGPAARVPDRRAAYDPVVFYTGEEPVALLMPLTYNNDDIPIDMTAARKQAQVLAQRRTPEQEQYIRTWLEIGREVPWMHMADPTFDENSFTFCHDIGELTGKLLEHDRHQLGAAFAYQDLCFLNLNSLDGGAEEWLCIKNGTAIANIPLRIREEDIGLDREATTRRVEEVVQRLKSASESDCADPAFRDTL